jgi:quinoprotein glucose dehydrogenase
LIQSFGEKGVVDLKKNFDRDMTNLFYKCTSPPVLYEDLIIVGGGGGEGPRPTGPGHIRAYDVYTGKRRWIFHTIPFPGEFGYDTWGPDCWKKTGGTNSWAGMSLDTKRGWVFASIGSPAYDFYGGDRPGKNLFGDCVIALNAATGERVWHYQIIHHDLWDYDLGCQPVLLTVTHRGKPVEAVAQLTKTGMVFLLDRETGEPLFPVEERPVPESDIPGEKAWPTQPFPLKPPPFARSSFNEEQITDISAESRAHVLERFNKCRVGPLFTPPSKQGTIVYTGYGGGAQWGGGSFDPESGLLFVNSNDVPWIITLIDAEPAAGYPYDSTGHEMFLDPSGYPANKPPWNCIVAIDLNKGDIVWQVPLGEFKELVSRGVPPTGTYGLGGSIVTKGGLIFTGATQDEKFRAFDARSGRVLWEAQLDAGAYATPCSYEAGGKQYVVIAAGGAGLKIPTKPGDAFVAFALP